MTPYRDQPSPRTTVGRTATQRRALLLAVGALSTASMGLAILAWKGEAVDPFLAGLGAMLCGAGAIGVLIGRVHRGSGSAPCPVCRARLDDVERTGRVEGLLCARCGRFLVADEGEIRTAAEDRVAAEPVFGAAVPEGFTWPNGCVVCGEPATQALPVEVSELFDRDSGVVLTAVGLTLAATVGTGFVVLSGKRVGVTVPHCAAHDDGAALLRGGPTGFVLLFRSLPYQRAFCKLNGTASIEFPGTGRRTQVTLIPAAKEPSPRPRRKPSPRRRASKNAG